MYAKIVIKSRNNPVVRRRTKLLTALISLKLKVKIEVKGRKKKLYRVKNK